MTPAALDQLYARLALAEDTLEAIRTGSVDAVVMQNAKGGECVYTLQGADHPYRNLIEQMAQGAATLSTEGVVLYANHQLAAMLGLRLETMQGCDIRTLIGDEQRPQLEALLRQAPQGSVRAELNFLRADASMPVYLTLAPVHFEGTWRISLLATDLSQRKRDDELVASDRLARSILENAAGAIFVCDNLGRVTRASAAADLLVGRSPLHELFDDLVTLRKGNGRRFRLTTVMQAGCRQGLEAALTTDASTALWCLVSIGPVRNDAGELLGAVVTVTDITERKRAEEALGARERYFRALIENSWEAVALVSAEGLITYASPATVQVLGYEPDELIILTSTAATYPEGMLWLPTEFANVALSRGANATTRHKVRHRDHRWVWIEATMTNLMDDPNVRGVVVNYHDITEQKVAEDRLRASEDRLRLAVESGDLGIWDFFPGSATLKWDAGCRRMFGLTLNLPGVEVPYETFVAGLHPVDRTRLDDALKDALQPEVGTIDEEFRTLGLDDAIERWVEMKGKCYFDDVGAPTRFVGTLNEVTARKRAEAELHRAKDTAEAASQAKSSFLANMSHEIRTPLGAILGFGELLKEPNLGRVEKLDFIDKIGRHGRELARLIDDILDLSKVEAGRVEIELLPVNLADLIRDVTELLGDGARLAGLTLEAAADGPVPETIVTDPTRLRQVLVNIVGNALKFTAHGGVRIGVKLVTQPATGTRLLAFSVSDTGCGIAAAEHDKLFKTFSQADASMTRRYGGTGLGLALSQRLARALGGNLVLDSSALGKGSTFIVTVDPGPVDPAQLRSVLLAAVPPPPPPAPAPAAARHTAAPQKALAGFRLLVADDGPDNRLLIDRILTWNGAVVDLVENGLEAVRQAELTAYDAILMDLQMPLLDGYGATSELRRRGYTRPIIALTAHAMHGERQRCLDAGCDDHLMKPINQRLLIDSLIRHAQGREKS